MEEDSQASKTVSKTEITPQKHSRSNSKEQLAIKSRESIRTMSMGESQSAVKVIRPFLDNQLGRQDIVKIATLCNSRPLMKNQQPIMMPRSFQ